jgi:hypothetical protein
MVIEASGELLASIVIAAVAEPTIADTTPI